MSTIPLTFATLILLTVAMVVFGIFWRHVPSRLRVFLPRAALAVLLLHVFFVATKWGTTSAKLNTLIGWLAVAGYELLIVLFARLSPRWLTTTSAAILILPVFASSVVSPLALIFHTGTIEKIPVGRNLYYKSVGWDTSGNDTSGVDLDIYYRPSFLPFLSHKLQTQSFNTDECNAFAATILPGPDPGTVLARCPHWPSQPPGSDDKLVPLR
jgi:hypothetical protein